MKNETPIYRLWANIKQRCYNPNHNSYPNYGGRGITMYAPWVDNFQLFESYILSLGEKPEGTSIDRVHNDQGYYPMNLRWSSGTLQLLNRRGSDVPTHMRWVDYHQKTGRYRGRFNYQGKRFEVGEYSTPEDAFKAVLACRRIVGLKS